MTINEIKQLFTQVDQIANHYKEISRITGDDFNIFKTLNLESSENKLHSKILKEFLNPKGTHGQGDLFLKIFLEHQKILDFDSESASADCEIRIGNINTDYTEGGRIDIVIKDENNKQIFIENKINATDQKNQLLRYYKSDPNAYLFYLNKDGSNPSEISTNGLSPEKYKIISYSYDIISWLEECRMKAVSLPIIRETITQYINVLKIITNQITDNKMKNDIKDLIVQNPEYINSIEICFQELQDIIKETKKEFIKLVSPTYPSYDTINSNEDIILKTYFLEDIKGFYIGYKTLKGDEDISNSETVKKYNKLFKELDNRINDNSNYTAYFYPDPFKKGQKFENFDRKEILKMNLDKEILRNYATTFIQDENQIRQAFLNQIEKTKK